MYATPGWGTLPSPGIELSSLDALAHVREQNSPFIAFMPCLGNDRWRILAHCSEHQSMAVVSVVEIQHLFRDEREK
jgi:hypothetical protein